MNRLIYRFLQTVRNIGNIFWGLFFPLILGTLFYFAFGNLGQDSWKNIPVAVVGDKEPAFQSFLEKLDGDMLALSEMNGEEAYAALADQEIEGFYLLEDEVRLVVGANGTRQTILAKLLKGFTDHSALLNEIARTHPEHLADAMEKMTADTSFLQESTLGGKSYNMTLDYFFALLAMACFFGAFTGKTLAEENAANVSALAARRSISPERKLSAVLQDLFVGVSIHFLTNVIVLLFMIFVLRLELSGSFLWMIFICLAGSLMGVSLGMIVGALSIPEGIKMFLLIAVPLFLCFLSGLMYGEMKEVVEQHLPVLNRINPAALISDAMYFLNVYDDIPQLMMRLGILFAMSVLLSLCACFILKRTRYYFGK